MLTEDLQKLVDKGVLSKEVMQQYLKLYLGPADWGHHIDVLYVRLHGRIGGDEAKKKLRDMVACTLLLPVDNHFVHIDEAHPEVLLFSVDKFDQFTQRDWFAELQKVVKQDLAIQQCRNQVLSLGVIDPLEYAPYCRQAYNWLYGKAEESGCITPETKDDIARRFKNLVWAYGGACISNVFLRHEDKVKGLLNWRSGYFFERLIFDVYKPEQVLKLKRAELEKTNARLVKKIRIDN